MTLGSTTGAQTPDTHSVLSGLENAGTVQSPVDLHSHLESIRNMPEFQPPQPGLMDELMKQPLVKELSKELDKYMEGLVSAINKLLMQIRPPGIATMPENIRDLFSGFVGFVLVLLGLYAFYIFLGWLLRKRETQIPADVSESRVLEKTRLISSAYHNQKAHEMAKTGQYDTAVRQLYFALLCLLDEKALVRFEATRTNGEYVRNLSGKASEEMGEGFMRLARRFEAAYYGRQHVSADQFAQCEQSYRQIEKLTGGGHG